jgi:uncharacterized phage infection (PIP) family protein YhgE
MENVEILESKVKNLQEEFQKENNFLNEINKSIKSLIEKRKETQRKLDTINGAVQAYHDSVNVLKPQAEEISTLEILSE